MASRGPFRLVESFLLTVVLIGAGLVITALLLVTCLIRMAVWLTEGPSAGPYRQVR